MKIAESEFALAIWFKPSRGEGENMPVLAYIVDERGFTGSEPGTYYRKVSEVYYNKKGENLGLREAREGRFSVVACRELQPYSPQLWKACEIYIALVTEYKEKLARYRQMLKSGKIPGDLAEKHFWTYGENLGTPPQVEPEDDEQEGDLFSYFGGEK